MEVEIEMKWYEIKVAVSRFRSTTKSWNFFKTNKLSAIIWRYFEYPLLALIFPFILYTELCSKIKLLKKHIWKKQNKLQNFSTLTEQKTIRSVFLYFWKKALDWKIIQKRKILLIHTVTKELWSLDSDFFCKSSFVIKAFEHPFCCRYYKYFLFITEVQHFWLLRLITVEESVRN